MATHDGFDIRELDELCGSFLRLAQEQYPEEAKTFLRKQGNEARKTLRAKTKAVTKKKTGNLLKGIDKSAPHRYQNDFQIRVYNKAPHAHLIEHGHVMADKFGRPIERNGKEIFVPGKHPAALATLELKRTVPEAADRWVDEMLERGFAL